MRGPGSLVALNHSLTAALTSGPAFQIRRIGGRIGRPEPDYFTIVAILELT